MPLNKKVLSLEKLITYKGLHAIKQRLKTKKVLSLEKIITSSNYS